MFNSTRCDTCEPFMLPGSLFVLEGPDGVGKTTLVSRVCERLRQSGVDCINAAFPGNESGSLGQLVHQLHHAPAQHGIAAPTPAALQLLHIAAHVDALERLILPALRSGRVVLLDRFWWSTLVYGLESGIAEQELCSFIQAETHFWRGVTPRIIFLLTRAEAKSSPAIAVRYQELTRSRSGDGDSIQALANEGEPEAATATIATAILESLRRTAERPAQRRKAGPDIVVWHGSIRPTPVFDTYWRFAAKRQEIFFRRCAGQALPWTDDPVLQEYKFTNAYRASDRVSQFLIRNVILDGDQAPAELFFRIILFKLFNRIDTWRYLEREVGPIRWSDYEFRRYDTALSRAMAAGRQIYSAAYIMPSARVFGNERKHTNHLRLIELMMKEDLPSRMASARSMEEAFLLIRQYPSIGDFLAYQYVTDLNYSDLTDFWEDEFVVPGPGARDGLRKCFSGSGGFSDADIIKKVVESQEREFERLELSFKTLWGRRLQYIDGQNLFCEVDKYSRVVHPEFAGLSGRTRIKQKFNATAEQIRYTFPKKWNLDPQTAQETQPGPIAPGQISIF